MSDSELSLLQETSRGVEVTGSPDEGKEKLLKAFELFSKETSRLEIAYQALKKQFQAVNLELEESNRQLNQKVQELDSTTDYLHNILSNMSQGILFIGRSGIITTFNSEAQRIFQVGGKLVLFQSFWEHFSDNLFGFSLHEALESEQPPNNAFPIYKEKALEVSTSFVRGEEQASQGMIILIRDITEMRRLQHLTTRQDRLQELGEMAAQVAHEIRNPLGGIKGFASLLERDLEKKPDLQKMARYIVDGTQTLDRLVSNVLHYARPMQTQFQPVELVELLDEVISMAKTDVKAKGVQCKYTHKLTTLTAHIDREMIKGAVLNLIVNAFQAMPEGGKLDLSLDVQENQALIGVTDNGEGIPEENLEKIYSPFFTTKPDGNGFGLSEVYKVVQAHGG